MPSSTGIPGQKAVDNAISHLQEAIANKDSHESLTRLRTAVQGLIDKNKKKINTSLSGQTYLKVVNGQLDQIDEGIDNVGLYEELPSCYSEFLEKLEKVEEVISSKHLRDAKSMVKECRQLGSSLFLPKFLVLDEVGALKLRLAKAEARVSRRSTAQNGENTADSRQRKVTHGNGQNGEGVTPMEADYTTPTRPMRNGLSTRTKRSKQRDRDRRGKRGKDSGPSEPLEPVSESEQMDLQRPSPAGGLDGDGNPQNTCAKCRQPFEPGQKVLKALDKKWHPRHFQCHECDEPLTKKYLVHASEPYCHSCFGTHFAPKCKACGERIMGKKLVVADATWHPKCFACHVCKTPLKTMGHYIFEGNPVCSNHRMGSLRDTSVSPNPAAGRTKANRSRKLDSIAHSPASIGSESPQSVHRPRRTKARNDRSHSLTPIGKTGSPLPEMGTHKMVSPPPGASPVPRSGKPPMNGIPRPSRSPLPAPSPLGGSRASATPSPLPGPVGDHPIADPPPAILLAKKKHSVLGPVPGSSSPSQFHPPGDPFMDSLGEAGSPIQLPPGHTVDNLSPVVEPARGSRSRSKKGRHGKRSKRNKGLPPVVDNESSVGDRGNGSSEAAASKSRGETLRPIADEERVESKVVEEEEDKENTEEKKDKRDGDRGSKKSRSSSAKKLSRESREHARKGKKDESRADEDRPVKQKSDKSLASVDKAEKGRDDDAERKPRKDPSRSRSKKRLDKGASSEQAPAEIGDAESPAVKEGKRDRGDDKPKKQSVRRTASSKRSKREPRDWKAVDCFVRKAPFEAMSSPAKLAEYFATGTDDDASKARAIFTWVARNIVYDTENFLAGTCTPELNSAGATMKRKKAVCEGYSQLVCELGRLLDLEVKAVSGFSKGAGYDPDSPMTEPDHAWNAFRVDKKWYLMDACWGAGTLGSNKKFQVKFQPHYFMSSPAQFVVDHLPSDDKWQLLKNCVSKEEFMSRAILKPAFFTHSLRLDSHKAVSIKARDTLLVSFKGGNDLVISAQIVPLRNTKTSRVDNSTFVQCDGSRHKVMVAFPRSGSYDLNIFVKKRASKAKVLDQCASYRVTCKRKSKAPSPGLPSVYSAFSSEQCLLYSPSQYRLDVSTPQEFKIAVPNAKQVFVIASGNKQPQELALDEDGNAWVATLPIQKGKLGIYAKLDASSSLTGLVEFLGSDNVGEAAT